MEDGGWRVENSGGALDVLRSSTLHPPSSFPLRVLVRLCGDPSSNTPNALSQGPGIADMSRVLPLIWVNAAGFFAGVTYAG